MHPIDLARELEKAHTAVGHAVKHLRATNQANAASHLSDEVLYSPLTVSLMNASESIERVHDALLAQDETNRADVAAQAYKQQFGHGPNCRCPKLRDGKPALAQCRPETEFEDWRPLPEDVAGHTLARFYDHDDARVCGYHNRLGVWTFDDSKECLRRHDFAPEATNG